MTFSPLYVDPKLFSQDKLHFINEMKNNHKSIILNDKSKLRKLNDSLKELIKNLQKTEKAFKEEMVAKGYATITTQDVDGYTVKAFTKKIFTFK